MVNITKYPQRETLDIDLNSILGELGVQGLSKDAVDAADFVLPILGEEVCKVIEAIDNLSRLVATEVTVIFHNNRSYVFFKTPQEVQTILDSFSKKKSVKNNHKLFGERLSAILSLYKKGVTASIVKRGEVILENAKSKEEGKEPAPWNSVFVEGGRLEAYTEALDVLERTPTLPNFQDLLRRMREDEIFWVTNSGYRGERRALRDMERFLMKYELTEQDFVKAWEYYIAFSVMTE